MTSRVIASLIDLTPVEASATAMPVSFEVLPIQLNRVMSRSPGSTPSSGLRITPPSVLPISVPSRLAVL